MVRETEEYSMGIVAGPDVDSEESDFQMENEPEDGGIGFNDAISQGPQKKPRINANDMVAPVSSPSDSTSSENDYVEYTWCIPNFSQIRVDRLYSPSFGSGPNDPLWRTLLFPHGNHNSVETHLSIYAELESPPRDPLWRGLHVQFQFQLLNQVNPEAPFLSEESTYHFAKEGSDRGFDAFFPLSKLKAGSEYIVNDSIQIRTVLKFVKPERMPSNSFVSSRETCGYVGLKNQGATCYMNSLLQTLFHIGYFRRSVYLLPLDEGSVSVALALQKVFAGLQTSDDSVCTRDLTASFGWQSVDSFMQHDVQEFSRVLCDNLETKMKNTPVEGVISRLFEGKSEVFIECINVDYKSSRVEGFYDLSLNVKGLRNLYESFAQYIETETLDGQNQYRADGYGLQDARKGIRFLSLPPVLFVQLKRFEYDPVHNSMVKLNDMFEFPVDLDLTKFMHSPTEDFNYVLHSVLVHSGSVYGGHYYACICPNPRQGPNGKPKWFKFDDDFVSAVPQSAAVADHFGGDNPIDIRSSGRRGRDMRIKSANAYMLVYIRVNQLDTILGDIKETDIPACIRERIASDELFIAGQEAAALAEAKKAIISVFTSQHLMNHNGIELSHTPTHIKIDHDKSCRQLVEEIESAVNIPADAQIWFVYSKRENKTIRANKVFDWRSMQEKSIAEMFDLRQIGGQMRAPRDVFIFDMRSISQLRNNEDMLDSTLRPVAPINLASSVLLFFKWFDPSIQCLSYVGCSLVPNTTQICEVGSLVLEMARRPPHTVIDIFEEEDVKNDRVTALSSFADATVVSAKLINGDIIICQERVIGSPGSQSPSHSPPNETIGEVPDNQVFAFHQDVPSYLSSLYHLCIVLCIPVTADGIDSSREFRTEMRGDWSMRHVATAIAYHFHCGSSENIRIYPKLYNEMLPNRNEQYSVLDSGILLEQIVKSCDESIIPIFFEVLDFSVHSLETHHVVEIHWIGNDGNKSIFSVLVPKQNCSAEVLFSAILSRADLQLHEGSMIRLVAVSGCRTLAQLSTTSQLDGLLGSSVHQPVYIRAEEVPENHCNIEPQASVFWINHFMPGYIPKFYGEPQPVVIERGKTLHECRESIYSQLDPTGQTRHRAQWIFARMPSRGLVGLQVLNDDDVIFPDEDLQGSEVSRFLCVDQAKDGPTRSARTNPLDRPIKIYN